ncbi:hypothetical protein [Limisalsivibrio acetivorans]|uniref:hypothetical protein n=1 Tax=Limisalsivibrio acetivorans TaxID=1304888 RepID=UPI0003B3E86A|nr:hypothetical protein [Limisalsivibrio acetivorans]
MSSNVKETVLIWVVIVTAVFLLFYWTHLFFQSQKEGYIASTAAVAERTEKAAELAALVETGNGSRNVQSGLLSFVQAVSSRVGINSKIFDLKPISSPQGRETVSIKMQALNYSELVSFLERLDGYDNTGIRSFSMNKRFDNPQLVDINLEITKSR